MPLPSLAVNGGSGKHCKADEKIGAALIPRKMTKWQPPMFDFGQAEQ